MIECNDLVVVRGGGDLATGVAHRLASAGFKVLILETPQPAAIRRTVCFSEAVYNGHATVEGRTALLADSFQTCESIWNQGNIPILVDPECEILRKIRPRVLVDAIIAKRNLGTTRDMAPTTIALGPGFTAPHDVDIIIETSRGHNLGRVIREGAALPNTGIPGLIAGVGKERVLHAPVDGIFYGKKSIAESVEKGEIIGQIHTNSEIIPIPSTISGLLRGLLRDGYPVTQGFKIADIDPRQSELDNCYTISDKSRCIAGSVLEQVCAAFRK